MLAITALAACSPPRGEVVQFGAMRPVMRDGDTGPRVALCDFASGPGTYAVGALEALGGEVTVLDGRVFVSRASEGGVETTGPGCVASDQATLLTGGRMEPVAAGRLDRGVDLVGLEEALRAQAVVRGGDPSRRPFLFVVEGRATRLEGHVIRGECPHAVADADAARIDERDLAVTLVGVYAEGRAGVMTHLGARSHVHALIGPEGSPRTLHVDAIELAPGALLKMDAQP